MNERPKSYHKFDLIWRHSISQFSSVQSLSHAQLFGTPWTAACQTSLSITNSQSLLKFMSFESTTHELWLPIKEISGLEKKLQGIGGSIFPAKFNFLFSWVQSLSHVRRFAALWTVARQASLSITNSRSLLKLMSIESVMPSNHLVLCYPFSPCLQSFPASGSFQMSQSLASGGQTIGTWTSASVLPMNIQDWFPLGWTGWISLQSKDSHGSSPTSQFKSINSSGLS